MGITAPPVEHLTGQITTTIDEVVEESTEFILVNYAGQAGRRNELQNALSKETGRLFGQIERGLSIEFHTNPSNDFDEETKKAIDSVRELRPQHDLP